MSGICITVHYSGHNLLHVGFGHYLIGAITFTNNSNNSTKLPERPYGKLPIGKICASMDYDTCEELWDPCFMDTEGQSYQEDWREDMKVFVDSPCESLRSPGTWGKWEEQLQWDLRTSLSHVGYHDTWDGLEKAGSGAQGTQVHHMRNVVDGTSTIEEGHEAAFS